MIDEDLVFRYSAAATDLDLLADATDCTGHLPDPWADYLEWILVNQHATPAGAELRRLITEVLG